MYRNKTGLQSQDELRCIRDAPRPPSSLQDHKWPNFEGECHPLLVANYVGVQISIEVGSGWFYQMHRNQENNGLRRTCRKVYDNAEALYATGAPPDLPSQVSVQDDQYVFTEWWREDSIPEDHFPYELMSEIVYTFWLWVVNTGNHHPVWIDVHDVWTDPQTPRRIGTMAMRADSLIISELSGPRTEVTSNLSDGGSDTEGVKSGATD